jgi:CheY-like chemotaxis protein
MQKKNPIALFIVVADDDPDDHQLVKEALSECDQNHIVTSVFNGRQLMDLLEQKGFYKHDFVKLPDLIILDMKMPILSGLEALELIKANQNFKNIPVYMLSEMNMKEHVEKAMSLGADDFFTKPLNYGELRDLMGQVCKRASQKMTNSDQKN